MMEGFAAIPTDVLAHYVTAVLLPGRKYQRIRRLVTSVGYLDAKLGRLGLGEVLADVRAALALAPADDIRGLRALEAALVQSARILGGDAGQLRGQLLARVPRGMAADLDTLLDEAAAWRGDPWLCPLTQLPGYGHLASFGPVSGFVDSLAVSDDGTILLAGDRDGGLRAWDLKNSELLWYQALGRPVNAVAFRPGSFEAVIGLHDGTVALWSLADRRLRDWFQASDSISSLATSADLVICGAGSSLTSRSLAPAAASWEVMAHGGGVSAVAILANGRRCVSGSHDGTLGVWDLADGRLLRRVPLAADRVLCAAAVPGTSLVVVGTRDKSVIAVDATTGECVHYRGHRNQVRSVTALADGRVATGSYDGQILVWDLARRTSQLLGSHTTWCLAVAAPRRSGPLASGSDDGVVRVWDVDAPSAEPLSGQDVRALAAGAGMMFAAVDRRITCRNLATGQEQPALHGHRRPVVTLAVTASGHLASGSYDQTIRLWDPATRKATVMKGHGSGVDAITVTPDGLEIVSVSRDGTWRRWDAATGAPVLVTSSAPFDSVVCVSPDGRMVITATQGHDLEVWQRADGRRLFQPLVGHRGFIQRLVVTPDSRMLLSASWDRSLRAWSLDTGTQLQVFEHDGWVMDLAVTADGRLTLAACQDGRIYLYSLKSLQRVAAIDAHVGGVTSICLSADGRTAISAGADRAVRAWDMADRTPLAAFQTDVPIRHVIMSDNGRVVAGTSTGHVVLLHLQC